MKKVLSVIVISFLFTTSYSQTFKEQAELAKNTEFLDRVKIAITKVAHQVGAEAENVNKQAMYDKRHKLSYDVIHNDMAKLFAVTIVSANTDIKLSSTDSDLEFMASAVWNNVAGVKASEK